MPHSIRAGFLPPVRLCPSFVYCLALAGFARPLRAQSSHPAASTSLARTFGQADDITVLSLILLLPARRKSSPSAPA